MSYYLRNFAGFFIQLYPCVVLLYVPFVKASCRYKLRKVMWGVSILAFVQAVLFPIITVWIYRHVDLNIFAINNFYMFTAVIIQVVIFIRCINEGFLKKIVMVLFSLLYALIQFSIVNVVPVNTAEADSYTPLTLMVYACSAAIFFPACLYLLIRFVSPDFHKLNANNIKSELKCILIMFCVYLVILIIIYSFPDNNNVISIRMVVASYVLLSVVFFAFFGYLIKSSIRRTNSEEQSRLYELQKIQSQGIINEIDNAKRTRHDQRHHLRVIEDMLEQGRTEEAKNYINGMVDNLQSPQFQKYCENENINFTLQYYISSAKENGIVCSVTANVGEVDVSPQDLTSLFENALENAINACKEFNGDKTIKVNIATVNNSLAAIIENSCGKVSMTENYKGSKDFLPYGAFKSLHGGGFGLRSLSVTAEKYSGDAAFKYDAEGKKFITRILLNP